MVGHVGEMRREGEGEGGEEGLERGILVGLANGGEAGTGKEKEEVIDLVRLAWFLRFVRSYVLGY